MSGGEGGTIPVGTLLAAYARGMFPMCHEDGELYWHDPDPRAIFPLDKLMPNARLRRLMRSGRFSCTRNMAFSEVIRACADREETWVDARIINSYCALHRAGYAHSVESWVDQELVGGLYGVAIGGAFFAESMFNRASSAGIVAFHSLVEHLNKRGFVLLDTQYINDFTARMGALEVSRKEFRRTLSHALALPIKF